MSQVTLPDPDAPMPPINLTARETYVQAESGIGLLKLLQLIAGRPAGAPPVLGRPARGPVHGLVEFGSYEWLISAPTTTRLL